MNRAVLSTSTEPRGFFLLEQPGMVITKPSELRNIVLVVETDDLTALKLIALEFSARSYSVVSGKTSDGGRFKEMLILSPRGHGVLVFEYNQSQ